MTRLLLEWVVTASLLILAVIALRTLLGKRISAGLKYALWAVVLVRLLVPLQFFSLPVPEVLPEADRAPVSASAAPAVSAVPAPIIQGEPVGVGTPAIAAPVPSGVVVNHNPALGPAAAPNVIRLGDALCWLWLAGALVMTAAFLISNLTFALRLRRVRTPLEGADCPLPVYIAGGLPSPCLFGLFRPAVYVTAETAHDPAMLRHILAHEHTHFRHGDHVWNVLRSAALAVHWWNPLVWLAVILSRRDCELACDEGALKRLGDGERIAYGRTLLALITEKPRPGDLLRCATTMTGGQKSVFDRVTRIARAPKRWLWAAVAAVIATALACVCAFGQADKPDTPPAAGVTADLTFSLETDSDGNSYVRMDGTVDGVALTRGASWEPPWRGMMTKKFPYGRVSMVYPAFNDGIEAHLTAGWSDEDHTKVVLTTEMTAMLSSLFNVGYWDLTVELDSGAVSMEGLSFRDGLPDGETRFYPESISEEEAVRAARIAAKLLTEGENYYNSTAGLFGFTADLTLSLSEADPQTVKIQGTVGEFTVSSGTSWSPVPAFDVDLLGNIFIPYPPFGGENGMIAAWWADESRTAVTVTGQPLPLTTSGGDYSGWRTFTAALDGDSGTITESHVHGSGENIYLAALSDEEAVILARYAAKLLTAAEDYYCNYVEDAPYLYTALLGGASFYSVDAEKSLTFDTIAGALDPYSHSYEITRYASVDFDGDGSEELVLHVKQQGEFYLIFHEIDGELYSYLCGTKVIPLIKGDGTVWDNYVYPPEGDGQGVGYSKVSFSKTGMELHPFTYELYLPGDLPDADKYINVVDGQPADSQTYQTARAALDARPDVVWHEFRPSSSVDLYAAMPELYADVFRGASKFILYENQPPISIGQVPSLICPGDEYMCFQRYAVVDLLGGAGRDETPQVLLYVCGASGDMAGYLLLWEEDGQVHGEIFDRHGWRNRWFIDLKTDGTFMCTDSLGGHDWMSISRLRSTAAGGLSLYSDAVWRGLDASGHKIDLESFMVIDQELDEKGFEQAMEAHRAKPDVTWYKLTLKDLDDAPAPVIDPGILDGLDGLTFSDGWYTSVNVEGVDVQEMYWYSPKEQQYPYGRMIFTNPAFLGAAFEGKQVNGYAEWTDDSHTAIEIDWSWDSLPYLDFSVDLASGTIDCDAVWDGLTDEDLLTAARILGALMERAEAYKTSGDYRPPMDGTLPFERPMELMFCSGAGAWRTNLLLYPDGSFVGDYSDADMTIEYVCQFHGRFGDIKQVTDASWSLTLEELVLDTKYPVGTEWDEGVIHYISSTPYGFDKKGGEGTLEPGAQFMLYTPEAEGYRPTDELYGMEQSDDYESTMRQFWGWWPDKHVWGPYAGPLGCYGLCNMASGQGFFDLNAWGIA